MQSFISFTLNKIISKQNNLDSNIVILPSKRACVFFKNEFKKQHPVNSFLPEIISISEFITQVSKIELLNNIEILFEFYTTYLKNTTEYEIVDFEQFSNWATILIQDFNEIDRGLIDSKYIFTYLSDIHRIENWFLKNNKETLLTKKHLTFFNYCSVYYHEFYKYLVKQKKGYQGIQYREANKNIESYLDKNKNNKFIFIGFNALNKTEENIIKKIISKGVGEIYFDIDQFFIDANLPPYHFIKNYKETWNYYNNNKFKTVSNDFSSKKQINLIGVPKNTSLIKEVGIILKKLNSNKYKNTALVLANENLLTTTLNSLPKDVKNVNITMGYPLKNIEISNLFLSLFKLHQNKTKLNKDNLYYYKDVLTVLNNSHLTGFYKKNDININNLLNDSIIKNNFNFINKTRLLLFSKKNNKLEKLINLLFSDWNNIKKVIKNCIDLLKILNGVAKTNLDIEYLFRFNTLFEQLKNLNLKYSYIKNLTTLQSVFKQLLATETLSFKGEPLSGLQIMGMLETRVLDFETVIITSANEGFIPSGKKNNSFIPFDVKKEFNLDTYKEKDAIFSYHFFRLIQRAKNIYLLYNTETDEFGSGEQSRFITQLEVLKDKLPNLTINKTIISPKLNNVTPKTVQVNKSKPLIKKLQEIAKKGLSPTSLTNYIYNPIDFYKNKILKIKSLNEIEETIAANTLGTIIHKALEELYKPYINIYLTSDSIKKMLKKTDKTIKKYFKDVFKNGDITTGKNLLSFKISKHYINTFLKQELKLIETGKKLKIIGLETDLEIEITIKNTNYPIKLTGQADRIDELDGITRIIDYKTGFVKQSNLNIKNWDEITTNYKKYSKSFQVLMYAYIYTKMNTISFKKVKIESGIISFKNLKSGFLKINKNLISNEDINKFETELLLLIEKIYNKEIPFIENKNLSY